MTPKKCMNCEQDALSDQFKFCPHCGTSFDVPGASENSVDGAMLSNNQYSARLSDLSDQAIKTGENVKKKVFSSFTALEEKVKEKWNENATSASSEVPVHDDINCEKFKSVLDSTITVKIAEVMRSKSGSEQFISFFDAHVLNATVENIFKSALTVCPPQIKAACSLSSAVLAPSAKEKQKAVRGAVGIAGGTAGMGMVISSVGAALGWGAGLISTVTAAFVGTSLTGPIGWGISGLALAGIAGYFAFSGGPHKDSERYINTLKRSTAGAVNAIWVEHGEALTDYLDGQSGRTTAKTDTPTNLRSSPNTSVGKSEPKAGFLPSQE